MKINEIAKFIESLKSVIKNKFYLSEEFINWHQKEYFSSESEAIEIFEQNQKKVVKQIKDYIYKCDQNDIVSEILFDEFDSDTIIKGIFKYKKDDQSIISNKIEYRNQFYELLKQIDWRELEKLAKIILNENHITKINITQSSNDQGIDFYGYYTFESEEILPRFYKFLNFRIIGQVKHSTKDVGVDHQKVASFGTEINKLRKSSDTNYFQNLNDEFLASDLPIIGIFITNSYYPKKAIDFAKEYGIIYWNGQQISEDLCTEELINDIKDKDNMLSLKLLKEKISKIS